MNPLALIPAPYRIFALLIAAAALVGFGFVKGAAYEQRAQNAREVAAERATTQRVLHRVRVTQEVDAKYTPQIDRIHVITETITKEIPKYVSVNDCPLSPGFRLLHDAAAQGQLPDAAGIADAAAVPAPDIAATVTDNYGSCLENAKRLEGLQEWVRKQQELNK